MSINTVLQTILIALILGFVLIATQLYTTIKTADTVREAAIEEWALSHPDGEAVVSQYRELCQRGPSIDPKEEPPFFSKKECAIQLGYDSLAQVIEQASNSVEVPAPLRWL